MTDIHFIGKFPSYFLVFIEMFFIPDITEDILKWLSIFSMQVCCSKIMKKNPVSERRHFNDALF